MQIKPPAKTDGRVMLWILLACIQILKQKKQIDGRKHTFSKGRQKTPDGICLFKVNNTNSRTQCEICSKLTIKTHCSSVCIVNFKHLITGWKGGRKNRQKNIMKKEDKGKNGSVGESLLNENVLNDEGETQSGL